MTNANRAMAMIAITTIAMMRPVISASPPSGFPFGLPRPGPADADSRPELTRSQVAARELLALALGRDSHDVAGEAELLHRADEPRRRVEARLDLRQPVLCRARERVVVVVPRLAEARQREPPDVGGVVLDGEPPAAEEVADRVDRPGDVVQQEDPHQAAPQHPGQRAGQPAGDQAADGGG